MILCEGYMDVIALHQAGFSGAVATLGTAVTPDQARVISRYAKTLYVSYDSDEAGRRADEKAIKYMNEVGVEVKILKVTGAKDPDEFIKKYGAESFRKLMTGASGQIDYRLSEIKAKYNMEIPEEKLSMVNEACALIAGIYSEMTREVYIMRLSDMTGISRDTIASDIKRRTRKNTYVQKQQVAKSGEETLRHYGDRINPDAIKSVRGAETEEHILGLLLLYPEYMDSLNGALYEDDFITDFNRMVFSCMKKLHSEGGFDISSLNEHFTPEQMGRIHSMYRRRRALTVNDIGILSQLCKTLKQEKEKLSAPRGEDMTLEELAAYIASKSKGKQ